jgi:hypothetical protein
LLQFYFGGCDLIDLLPKERQLRKGRIVFDGPNQYWNPIDLKLHLKRLGL